METKLGLREPYAHDRNLSRSVGAPLVSTSLGDAPSVHTGVRKQRTVLGIEHFSGDRTAMEVA